MVLANVNLGDLLWSMVFFFFLFIWIMILLQVLADLFRDHSESGAMKALWVIFIVILPFLAVLVYLIARGKGMAERNAALQKNAQKDFDSYVQNAAGAGTSPTDQIAKAKELLDAGTIDQGEFDSLKAKALA
jgi:ABC-type multidrug transport system fused ATPase/permease subunit